MANFLRNIHPLLRTKKRKDEYDDTNFSILNALNYELTQTEKDTIQSKIQSSLETSTGEYLDNWGDWFGVYREDGWKDDFYRKRIIRYLLLKRGTIPAIIDAILDFLDDYGANVQIYEPWRNIFYLNKSKLNGEDHLMGRYYRFAIIDISIDRPFPPEIVEVIEAFKPAGVLFYLRLNDSMNPNKKIVPMPVSEFKVRTRQELEHWSGIYWDSAGDVNLGDVLSQVNDQDIFHTNRSMLNGEDVLGGSFSHGREYIHIGSISEEDFTPEVSMGKEQVLNYLEEDKTLSLYTQKIDGLGASVPVSASGKTYLYQVLDIYTFLEENYPRELNYLSNRRESLETIRNAIYHIMQDSTISATVRAMTPASLPMKLELQIYDFESEEWQVLQEFRASGWWQTSNIELGYILDYVSEANLAYIRIKGQGLEEAVDFEVDYLSLRFNSRIGEGYSVTSIVDPEDDFYIPLKEVVFPYDKVELGLGETFELEAIPIPDSATPEDYIWDTEDSQIVDVNDQGRIQANGLGETKITVYLDDHQFSATIPIKVIKRAEDIYFSKEGLTVEV